MKIQIPTLSGITNVAPWARETIRAIEQLVMEITALTSRGIVPKANISHEIVSFRSEEGGWVTVPHSLRREPLGYLLREGPVTDILEVRLSAEKVQARLAKGAKISIVVM
jgi:hypothetical protein